MTVIAQSSRLTEPTRRGPGRPTLSNEELLDTALELFLENGFERTGIEAVAAAAGMAKRTVYARYADKETLFRAALRRAIADWIVPVARLRAEETGDLAETLLRIGRILVDNIMSPAGQRLFRLTNTVSGRMPEIGAENVRQGTEPTIAYLADLFARRIGQDIGRNIGGGLEPREAAMSFMHLVVGGPSSMASWGVEYDHTAIERHTLSSVSLFLHGLLPRFSAGTDRVEAIEDENRRLRMLLTDALLENTALKEAQVPAPD